jgi:hypothetical protein
MSSRVLIAFTTSNAIYAKVLRWLMRARVHHCLMFLELEEFGGWMALEIDEDGVHVVHPNRALKRITKMECYETDYNLSAGIAALSGYIGKGYDWKGLLWGVWRLVLWRLFGYISKKALQDTSRMFCSEFVTAVVKRSGIPGTDSLEPASTWPPLLRDVIALDSGVRYVPNPFDARYDFEGEA